MNSWNILLAGKHCLRLTQIPFTLKPFQSEIKLKKWYDFLIVILIIIITRKNFIILNCVTTDESSIGLFAAYLLRVPGKRSLVPEICSVAPNNIIGTKICEEDAWNRVSHFVEGILWSKNVNIGRLATSYCPLISGCN